jgi:hypothetical protein
MAVARKGVPGTGSDRRLAGGTPERAFSVLGLARSSDPLGFMPRAVQVSVPLFLILPRRSSAVAPARLVRLKCLLQQFGTGGRDA